MNAWSREDIVVAFALYCVTPLNKINPTNLIPGRTPETAIIALSYGFVLAAQIKSKL